MACGESPLLQGNQKTGKEKRIVWVSFLFFFLVAYGSDIGAGNTNQLMKGPHTDNRQKFSTHPPPTSCIRIAFLESIKFYQQWISPIRGDRCGFRPSCSRFGYTAVTTEGPVMGLMLTGDRLIRCNIWKEPGPDYFLLPNGRLFDPLSKNLLVYP